jgi:hypothetical protein
MESSSKVILIGATSLIVGMYASALKNVQSQQILTAQMSVNRVQRLYSADAALRSALNTFVKVNKGNGNVSEMKNLPNGGGTFTNKITKGSLNTVDSVTITYPDGSTQIVTAIITKLSDRQKYTQGARKIHNNSYVASQILVYAVKKPKS